MPSWIGYVVAAISVAALATGLVLLKPVIPLGAFPMPYIVVTMVIAYLFGLGPALVACGLSWLAFDFFFVPPLHSFGLATDEEGWARQIAFVLGVVIVGIAASEARKANRRIAERTARLEDQIREREQAQEALQETEEQLRLLVEGISDYAIFMLDREGNIASWNPGAERIMGYASEEMIGRHLSSFYTSEGVAAGTPEQELALAVEQGEHSLEGWRARKDGSRFWAAVTTAALRDSAGNLRGFAKVMRDMTERKQAEEEIRKLNTELEQRVIDRTAALDAALKQERAARSEADASGAKVRQLLEMAPDGILIATQDGSVSFVNNKALEMFGYEPKELLGAQVETLIPERYRDAHVLHRADYAAEPRTRPMGVGLDLFGLRKDGTEFPVEIALSPTWTDGELTVTAIIRDITERKRSEQQIRSLNEDLRQRAADLEASNKELEAFSYSVSHDLRAPLRAIDGFSSALLKHYLESLDEKAQDYLQRVRAASQRMAQLIDDILGLSRATRAEMHMQPVDLSEMSLDILSDLRKTQPDRQAEIEVQPGLTVNGDPHLVRIAMNNLLGNAWKFTSKREVARIEVGAIEQNGERVYFVRDNGAGFSLAYADKLFSPFQRLHSESEFPGTGIGLALVQRILRRHRGRIWAESEEEKGATFFFTLGDTDK